MSASVRSIAVCLFIPFSIVGIGCDSSSDTTGGPSMNEMAGAMSSQRDAAQQKDQTKAAAKRAAQEAQRANQPPAERPRQAAGRSKVGEGGYYTAIVGARRHVLNKVDQLAWIQAVQHFQATEGRLPKDHDEFMNKVVKPLDIDLGYKEENQEFLYDPSEGQWGQLYVVEKIEQPAQP